MRKRFLLFLIGMLLMAAPSCRVRADQDFEETESTVFSGEETGGWIDDGNYAPSGMDSRLPEEESFSLFAAPSGSAEDDSCSLPDDGFVTPVKSQGQYGTCWAFAALASAESNYLLRTGEILDLSESQLVYYTFHADETTQPDGLEADRISYVNYPKALDLGGNYYIATAALARWTGTVDEELAPYGDILDPGFDDTEMSYRSNSFVLENVDMISLSDRNTIKAVLREKGALAVSIYHASAYETTDVDGYCAIYDPDGHQANHGVAIVGWDDRYSRKNFSADHDLPESDGAWLIKNSYGTGYGKDGYAWLSYENVIVDSKGAAVDCTAANFRIARADESSMHVYQHDGIPYASKRSSSAERFAVAEVFEASYDEQLTAASLFMNNYSQEYTLRIYEDVDGSPDTGKVVLEQEGIFDCAGYHVVELQAPVAIEKGTKFAVEFELRKGVSGNCTVYAESNFSTYSSTVVMEASAESGQSYYRMNGGWIDFGASAGANWHLKAFADAVVESGVPVICTLPEESGLNERFTVTISSEDGTVLAQKSGGAGEQMLFDVPVSERSGKNRYLIRQISGDDPRIVYDDSRKEVTASSSDGRGVPDPFFYEIRTDGSSEGAVFENTIQRAEMISGHTYVILSAKDYNYALDVAGGSRLAKANVDLYRRNGTEGQAFTLISRGSGTWEILNYKGTALDVSGASKANGANVQTYSWNATNAQKFTIESNADGTVTFRNVNSQKVLDVKSGKTANKTNIQQYTSNGTDAQKWILTDVTDQMMQKTYEGTFTIRSALNNSYVLDIAGGSKNNKANVQIYRGNGTAAQTFSLTYRGDGCYSITNLNSGKVLDAAGGKAANKTNVQQYGWNGTKAQLWVISQNSDGSVTIKPALNPDYVLDVSGGKAANRQNLQIYKSNGSKAQKFILEG